MGKVRRRFTVEFKEAICESINEGKSLLEICKEHQVHRQTILEWFKKYQQGTPLGNASSRERSLERQVYALQAKVGQLSLENEFLKKAKKELQQRRSVRSSVITGKNLEHVPCFGEIKIKQSLMFC